MAVDCSSRESIGLLEILERVVSKPMERKTRGKLQRADFADVELAVVGLVKVRNRTVLCKKNCNAIAVSYIWLPPFHPQAFRGRLCQQPATFVIRIYHILTKYLEDNFNHAEAFAAAGHVRLEIFRLLLSLRSGEDFHLGLSSDTQGIEIQALLKTAVPEFQSSALLSQNSRDIFFSST